MPHVQLHEVDTLGELKDVLDECLISGWMYVVGSTASIRSVARRLEVDGDDCSVFYTYRHRWASSDAPPQPAQPTAHLPCKQFCSRTMQPSTHVYTATVPRARTTDPPPPYPPTHPTIPSSLEDAENSMLCEGYELDLGFSDVGGPGYIYAILLEDEEEEHYDSDHSYGGDTHRTYSRRRRRAGEGHAPIHIGNIYLGEGPNRNRQALVSPWPPFPAATRISRVLSALQICVLCLSTGRCPEHVVIKHEPQADFQLAILAQPLSHARSLLLPPQETLAVGAKVVSSMATVGAAAVGCGCTIM